MVIMKNKGCIEPGCKNSHYGRGLCRPHYYQQPDIKENRIKTSIKNYNLLKKKRFAHKKGYSGLLREKYT